MEQSDLFRVSMIQSHIVREDINENINNFKDLFCRLKGETDLVVLPELFTTGLTTRTELAEQNDGKTISEIKKYAADYNFALTGSYMASDNGKYFNRAFFITPDGKEYFYDKRHLFSFAGEDKCFSSGAERLVLDYQGWKICLMICYDLRFPVWSRNVDNEYDLLIYVANWPEVRRKAWKALLRARAIENMCYTCGVNRVGTDEDGNKYHGGSSIFSPKGKRIFKVKKNEVSAVTGTIDKEKLESFREKFPVWKDADRFEINDLI